MEKQELIKEIRSEINNINKTIDYRNKNHMSIDHFVIAVSNYYIALATLVSTSQSNIQHNYD